MTVRLQFQLLACRVVKGVGPGLYVRPALIAGQGKEHHQRRKRKEIRYKGDNRNELSELGRGPRPLQIPPPMVYRHRRDGQRKHIVLYQCRREKRPRVDYGELRHKGQVGDDDVGAGGPLAIPDRRVQDGLDDQHCQDRAGGGRDVYPGRHCVVGITSRAGTGVSIAVEGPRRPASLYPSRLSELAFQ